MKNIAYAGALVALLDIDMAIVEQLLDERFASKKALRESNTRRCCSGYDYAKEHFECPLPFHLEQMDANDDKILIDGNTAAALGCVYAGATVAAWYPDHASDLGDGRVQGVLRTVPQGPGDRQE